ncbi:hypothetical protein LOTGIDRAFT_119476 [Lottia gigantea]|uniref:DUF7064 domain-containing protein n=1 Tax=Lottia gigantea TaxID=225164 RepID=V4ADL6_LOTGI|nr:hypothetical protein LOTGIDRAFT_119476 [Lottia gigantea]ESO93220.1 hypothetical protein LOTGIDRAFT_119476 [Lottia gigantea]
MIYLMIFLTCLPILALYLLIPERSPIHGVYRQKGRWYYLKYWIFRMIFWLRSYQNKRLTKSTKNNNAGYGLRSRVSPGEMDKVQTLNHDHPLAVDAVYFNGGSKDGVYMVLATARRHNNLTQTILILRLPGIGLLEMPTQPDTNLVGKSKHFSAGGLTLKPVEPMKKWKLSFNGQLRYVGSVEETNKYLTVSFELEWNCLTPYFDFDTDLNPNVMSDAIAREKWSREYFNTLQKAHQTHYEQFGEIKGNIGIEGYHTYHIEIQGVRDHSYGNIRDWKHIHRYGIQYMYFVDGTSACIGVICMPSTMSRLVIGYVFKPNGSMETVSSTDFELYNFGDDGNPPVQLSFNFTTGTTEYKLDIEVIECPVFYMGENWDAKIYERFCKFQLNGVVGWGISEWDYR